MLFKIRYRDNDGTEKVKIEETTEDLERLLIHDHVISAVEVKEKPKPIVEEVKREETKETKAKERSVHMILGKK
jgi:TPP-dependent pyruvate/acetoin dehydrogenase alpha subunit